MTRFRLFIASTLIAFMTWPALAQQGGAPSGPGPGYGYGHMWGGGWGWHPGMIFGPFFMILAVVGAVALVMWLARGFGGGFHRHGFGHGFCPHCGHGRSRGAADILAERFAKGEIGKEEFEEKRRLIGA